MTMLLPRLLGPILILCLRVLPCSGAEDLPGHTRAWHDAVTYRVPDDTVTKDRVGRAAEWLKSHTVFVAPQDPGEPLCVVAWKDPTLHLDHPGLLTGYLITDTLWSAKALKCFDPTRSEEMERSLQRLGWYGNGLHDVLFHPLDKILHCPADRDFVHGFSLGTFSASDGTMVNLRVFRQKWDADFDVGHPSLFAEHAVYRAIYDFWQHREQQARRRVRQVIADRRAADPRDHIFWDDQAGILVDHVTMEDWLAFREGERPDCRHYTFKVGLLLYAIRLLGMEHQVGSLVKGMQERLWSAQTESGGIAHFVNVQSDGTATPGLHATGEATAVAILAEVVEAKRPG